MYLNTRIFLTTGYARVLLFMFIRPELGGTRTGCLFQFTYCDFTEIISHSFSILLSVELTSIPRTGSIGRYQ